MKYHKICLACKKEFETNNPQKIYCNDVHYLPCPVCGTLVEKKDHDFSRPNKCCSSKCAHELRKQKLKTKTCAECGESFLPKSGVSTICDKQHVRTCEICGKEFEVSKRDIHDNITTCCHECNIQKAKNNSLAKYGVEYPMQNEEVQQHFKLAMKRKYGVEHALQLHDLSDKQQQSAYETNMKNHGVPYACLLPQCIAAQGNIISNINRKFGKLLDDSGIAYQFERHLANFSYDIAITGKNTLIEIDPTYTHNTIKNHWGLCRDKYYHCDKSALAQTNGYRCIHIFDWDNVDKIIDMLKPTTRLYARNLEIWVLHKKAAEEFVNEFHLQGSCRGQLLCLGLVKDNVLYQVMTFGKPRYDKSYDVELLRLCTRPGYTVVGGASKLFSYATKQYGLSNIISYCDLAKFSGNVYEKIGMNLVRTTPPQEIWSKGTEHITANLLRQHGYDQLFGTHYGKGVSNQQCMIENDWLPVYDCGQAVYEYK